MPSIDVRVDVLRGNTDKSRPLSPPGFSPCSLLFSSVSTAMADDWLRSRETMIMLTRMHPISRERGLAWDDMW